MGENEKEIIKMVGLGVLVLSSFVLPGLPIALKPFIKKQGKKRFQRTLKNLDEKGVIYLHGDRIKLSKKGQKLLKEIQIKEIEISLPAKWDSIWRLVSYDIPDSFKKERDWFGWTLKRLGFKRIQESLWAYPYECKEEIAVIAQNLRISPFVIIMATNHLPQEQKLIKLFNI